MAVTLPLIEVRGAAFRYGDHSVFSCVDLDIFRGEVLTVLGPNGCGKSTLLRCIGGALALAEGTVRIEGVDVSSLDAGARARNIAFLFQRHLPSFPFPVCVCSACLHPRISIWLRRRSSRSGCII